MPSPNAGPPPAQTSAPQQQGQKRNRLYVVLAVVGVLVLGAAAAIGVPAIVNGAKSDNSSSASASTTTAGTKTPAAPLPPGKITVAVLNGTSTVGLAQQVGDRVDAEGFNLGTVSNAPPGDGQRANSVAMYTPGHEREAARVARQLGIHNVEQVDANSRQIAGNASVVVVVGSDKTQ
jgi:hypothetical protein